MWIGISVVVEGSWDFSLLCLVVENDLLTITVSINQSLLLQQFWNSVAICHHQVSCKQYDCLHVWHPWDQHAQVKAILAFIIESLSRCFFFVHYICTIHAIITKLDNVRTRNRNSLNSVICSSYIAHARLKILLEMIHSHDRWL